MIATSRPPVLNVSEEFVWDGLALLYRNGETFAIEPHVSGGIPLASTRDPQSGTPTYYLNDILGTTLAIVRGSECKITPLTAFGRPVSSLKTPGSANDSPAGSGGPSNTPTLPTSPH